MNWGGRNDRCGYVKVTEERKPRDKIKALYIYVRVIDGRY